MISALDLVLIAICCFSFQLASSGNAAASSCSSSRIKSHNSSHNSDGLNHSVRLDYARALTDVPSSIPRYAPTLDAAAVANRLNDRNHSKNEMNRSGRVNTYLVPAALNTSQGVSSSDSGNGVISPSRLATFQDRQNNVTLDLPQPYHPLPHVPAGQAERPPNLMVRQNPTGKQRPLENPSAPRLEAKKPASSKNGGKNWGQSMQGKTKSQGAICDYEKGR